MSIHNILIPSLTTFFVLSLAILGNLFVTGFNWNLMDFLVMGIMVFPATLFINIFITRVKNNKYRLIVSLLILLTFLYIWAELGVGIFFNFGS